MATGYIYLIECHTDYEETHKIGFTRNKDIKKRINNLKTGNPGVLSCVYLFKTKHSRKVETALHNIYSYKKKNREWFLLDLNDITSFMDTCDKLESNFDILEKQNIFY